MTNLKDVFQFAINNPKSYQLIIFGWYLDYNFKGTPNTKVFKEMNIDGVEVIKDVTGLMVLSNKSKIYFVSENDDKFFTGSGLKFDAAYKHVNCTETNFDKISLFIRMPMENILPFNY